MAPASLFEYFEVTPSSSKLVIKIDVLPVRCIAARMAPTQLLRSRCAIARVASKSPISDDLTGLELLFLVVGVIGSVRERQFLVDAENVRASNHYDSPTTRLAITFQG